MEGNHDRRGGKGLPRRDFAHVVDETVAQRAEFDAHLAALRADFPRISFEFTTVIAEGSRAADLHWFNAVRKDGAKVRMKFIGVYTFRDGKISRFEELSRLIDGDEKDRNIPSRIR